MHARHLRDGRICYSHEPGSAEALHGDLLHMSDAIVTIVALLCARFGRGVLRVCAIAGLTVGIVRQTLLIVASSWGVLWRTPGVL